MEENMKRQVLNTFKESLNHLLGKSLQEIILFGSQARGDGDMDSDYDMLVIAQGGRSDKGIEKNSTGSGMDLYGKVQCFGLKHHLYSRNMGMGKGIPTWLEYPTGR